MKNEYEKPEVLVIMAKLRSSVLQTTGGTDIPDIPPIPGDE